MEVIQMFNLGLSLKKVLYHLKSMIVHMRCHLLESMASLLGRRLNLQHLITGSVKSDFSVVTEPHENNVLMKK